VIPQEGLAYLPFDALIVEQAESGVQYLLDVCPPMIYAPSISLLMRLYGATPSEQKSDRLPVLTLGDPLYPTPGEGIVTLRDPPGSPAFEFARAGSRPTPLPFSGKESQWVAEAFGAHDIGVGQLLQGKATEANVRHNAPGRRVIHLACHGWADSNYGNFFGALALAEGPRAQQNPADDGYLTVAEIYPLDLRACEIAILSACQTNIGPLQQGEGVWTISRGFLVAGSKRVVCSLWSVSDQATAYLVNHYAESMAKGLSEGNYDYAAGLHDAKRFLRNQSGDVSKPKFWAPFVLIGPQ
jgi:CHAT domain-containing protein